MAFYQTTGGNQYRLFAHNCVESYHDPRVGYSWLWESRSRTHFHCYRNGVSWDGCRINAQLELQYYNGGWLDFSLTENNVSVPGGSYDPNSGAGWFDNSVTVTSFYEDNTSQWLIRGAVDDPDNMRFRLADGTTVLLDLTSSVSDSTSCCWT